MRFGEKLPKLRKDNNLSQEQLADRLGVSRQAVSKWESGNSYPDMEKMLQICKILNCHLEDLMDDGAIGSNNNITKNKIDLNAYMKDFLDFITKSYNMFCSMKFKQKVKCIFEMVTIFIALILVSTICYSVFQYVVNGVIPLWLWMPISKIITIILITISAIVFIHLFKIRYLDYFITVEDQNATQKTIEEPIEKKENKYYQEQKKEKIIIRDPKHSTFKFFDILGKILILMVKIFTIFIAIPAIIMFVILVGFMFASIMHLGYGIIFLFIAIAFAGAILLTYDIIELIYNFIVNKDQHFKRLFILGITGLIMCGAGGGLAICTWLNYETTYGLSDIEYSTKTETIEMQDDLYISKNLDCEYKIDNLVTDIKLEINYADGVESSVNIYNNKNYKYCSFQYDINPVSAYKIVMKDIKNKKIRDYNISSLMKITITVSQENYDKLQANYDKLYLNKNIFIN